ncbi:MAG: hypothetical protein IBX55_03850 [Methyloprofundus sp.]|nr:hypothetical protein [Methyloprofundus sp.]
MRFTTARHRARDAAQSLQTEQVDMNISFAVALSWSLEDQKIQEQYGMAHSRPGIG